jgi:hypothetical protein
MERFHKGRGGGQPGPPRFNGTRLAAQFDTMRSDAWYAPVEKHLELLKEQAEKGLLVDFVRHYFAAVARIAGDQPTLVRREFGKLARKLSGGAAAMVRKVDLDDLKDWMLDHLESPSDLAAAEGWAASAVDHFASFFRDSQVFRRYELPDFPAMFFELLDRLEKAHDAKAEGEHYEFPTVPAGLLGFFTAYLESQVVLSIPTNDGHVAMSWPMSRDDFPKYLTLDEARLFLLTRHQIDVAKTTLKARARSTNLKAQGKFDRDLLDDAAKTDVFKHGNKREK